MMLNKSTESGIETKKIIEKKQFGQNWWKRKKLRKLAQQKKNMMFLSSIFSFFFNNYERRLAQLTDYNIICERLCSELGSRVYSNF